MWILNDQLHRSDGPAYIEWFADGEQKIVEWWQSGALSRAGGPAAVEYHSADGESADSVANEQWWVEGRLHRLDGPAFEMTHANGQVVEQQWWQDGLRVEGDAGAAVKRWSDEGEPIAVAKNVQLRDGYSYDEASYQGENDCLNLRLWHRWLLGLEPAPEDAPFTNSKWIVFASEPEVQSRLAYYPDSNAIAQRVLAWRELPKGEGDPVEITERFVALLREQLPYDEWLELSSQALEGGLSFEEGPLELAEGETDIWDFNEIGDELSVPRLVHETIYNASGNWFSPIYWITEPWHGVDVTAWLEFDQLYLRLRSAHVGSEYRNADSHTPPTFSAPEHVVKSTCEGSELTTPRFLYT